MAAAGPKAKKARTSADEQARQLNAIVLHAKCGDWDEVFAKLGPLKPCVNVIPEGSSFGILHQAAFWGNDDAIRRLVVDFGADLALLTRDAQPRTSLDVAWEEEHRSTADYLERLAWAQTPAEVPLPGQEPASPKKSKSVKETTSASTSGYYQQIKGVKYKAALLEKARSALCDRGGSGKITKELAQALWAEAMESGGRITDVEWETLKYIVEGIEVPLTPDADGYLSEQLDQLQTESVQKVQEEIAVGSAGKAAAAGATDIEFTADTAKAKAEKSSLRPGDVVVIDKEYYQVTQTSAGGFKILGLLKALSPGATVKRVGLGLVSWRKTLQGATKAFIDTVEKYNPSKQPSAEAILLEVQGPNGKLPSDPKKQQVKLIEAYTAEDGKLYSCVNRPLRENIRAELYKYAGYIRALRDCFREGDDQVLRPFLRQTTWRGENVDPGNLNELMNRWSKGEEVTFASFVSTSDRRGSTLKDRNVLYRINCYKFGLTGHYFPASVRKFSKFPEENEVLWPPQCKFRIVNMKKCKDKKLLKTHPHCEVIIEMETCEWPSIWEIIKNRDWKQFEQYAEKNPEVIQTTGARHSVINEVCKEMAMHPEEAAAKPIEICAAHGDINEVDPETGDPAVVIVAKAVKSISSKKDKDSAESKPLNAVLATFKDFEADMHKKGDVDKRSDKDTKESAVDILGEEFVATSASYYKQEYNVKYVRALLVLASRFERIGKEQAERIFEFVERGRGLTDNKKTTLKRILEGPQDGSAICQNVKFTPVGKQRFKELLASKAHG